MAVECRAASSAGDERVRSKQTNKENGVGDARWKLKERCYIGREWEEVWKRASRGMGCGWAWVCMGHGYGYGVWVWDVLGKAGSPDLLAWSYGNMYGGGSIRCDGSGKVKNDRGPEERRDSLQEAPVRG